MSALKTFVYRGELYLRVIPSKQLFKSTMVHEVVNRGDVFAIRISDSQLTIVPGQAQVDHSEHFLMPTTKQIVKEMEQRAFIFGGQVRAEDGMPSQVRPEVGY